MNLNSGLGKEEQQQLVAYKATNDGGMVSTGLRLCNILIVVERRKDTVPIVLIAPITQ